MKYTDEEKLIHLQKARAFGESGSGTFTSYARECGVSRSAFCKWVRAYGYRNDEGAHAMQAEALPTWENPCTRGLLKNIRSW
jgi:transposase-like protein